VGLKTKQPFQPDKRGCSGAAYEEAEEDFPKNLSFLSLIRDEQDWHIPCEVEKYNPARRNSYV